MLGPNQTIDERCLKGKTLSILRHFGFFINRKEGIKFWEDICSLKQINVLRLSTLHTTRITEEILKLKDLKELSIRFSGSVEIEPHDLDFLGELENLKFLNIYFINGLDKIPQFIYRTTNKLTFVVRPRDIHLFEYTPAENVTVLLDVFMPSTLSYDENENPIYEELDRKHYYRDITGSFSYLLPYKNAKSAKSAKPTSD